MISSCLDYCNSLLYGLPNNVLKKYQMVQNAAAKVICKARKYEHVTPFFLELHWLPVYYRIQFKILLLTYKCLNGQGAEYLCALLSVHSSKRELKSSVQNLLYIPRTVFKSCGDRAFSFAAPTLWNSLPVHIKNAKTVESFKSGLKTYLFAKAFQKKVSTLINSYVSIYKMLLVNFNNVY